MFSKEKIMKIYNIGVEATVDVIGGKWKPVILCNLKHRGRMRPSELLRAIPDMSQKVLTAQLRELEDDGIVRRIVYPEVPPRVEYALSEYGRTLNEVLGMLCNWGERHVEHLRRRGVAVRLQSKGDEAFDAKDPDVSSTA